MSYIDRSRHPHRVDHFKITPIVRIELRCPRLPASKKIEEKEAPFFRAKQMQVALPDIDTS